jgi:hypothetical protein
MTATFGIGCGDFSNQVRDGRIPGLPCFRKIPLASVFFITAGEKNLCQAVAAARSRVAHAVRLIKGNRSDEPPTTQQAA